jgi:hypothetical protein
MRNHAGVATRLGAGANVVAAGALAAAFASARSLFSSADESAHFDYAYQVWRGRLPVFEDGLLFHQTFGLHPPAQWTAQHPPMYYVLQAPFVGPLVDAGHVLAAGYAARAVNALLACALVAAVMWATSAIAPGRRRLWLAAGAVTAANPLVIAVGGSIYNDNLLAVWATLLVGLTARMIRRGCTARRLLLFALVAAAALLTRSAGVAVIAVCAGVLGLVLLSRRPRPWRAIAGLVAAVAGAIAASAWFYVRNLHLTGNLLGGHFDYLPGRLRRPVLDVALDPSVWKQLLGIYGYDLVDRGAASVLLAGLPLAVTAVLVLRRLARRPAWVPDVAVVALLAGLAALVLAMQLQYVSTGGGASSRYLEPLVVVFSSAIAWSLTAWPRLSPYLLAAWLGLAYLPFVSYVRDSLATPPATSTAPVHPAAAVAGLAVGGLALAVAVAVQALLGRTGDTAAGDGAAVTDRGNLRRPMPLKRKEPVETRRPDPLPERGGDPPGGAAVDPA